jgi:uncharacterized protein (DUF1501 family)
MKRRELFKAALPATTTAAAVINGFSVKAMANESPLVQALMGNTTETDHVLVLVQLNGGNDGLNMVIPLEYYGNYVNARSNIAIAQNKVLNLGTETKAGLHPSLTGLQALYNEGKLSVIHSVGYPSPNFSHFRATDIWMSASDSNQVLTTGWAGRYLQEEFTNFPNGYPNSTMPDPLAIQIGSLTALALQGAGASMGMSISDPNSFYNFINNIEDPVPATPWGKELTYIRLVARQTQQYADVIKTAAGRVPDADQVAYPANNDLAAQLRIVSKLIKGGLKTRVYMVSTGGFDTHANQVVSTDTSTGTHANLMTRVSTAIKAFMDDMEKLGTANRVIGMTFSEFGRRVRSNSSVGTDHGAAAPVFLFGKKIKGGILGNTPVIPANASVNDNIPFQYDFRSIYASLLSQWFCVNDTTLRTIMLKDFQKLALCNNNGCLSTSLPALNNPSGTQYITNYPNPFVQNTTLTFKTRGGHTLVQIMDTSGRVVKVLTEKEYQPGTYNINFDSGGLPAGVYYARFQNGSIQQIRSMLKVR